MAGHGFEPVDLIQGLLDLSVFLCPFVFLSKDVRASQNMVYRLLLLPR